jgi:hypothetical protein
MPAGDTHSQIPAFIVATVIIFRLMAEMKMVIRA